MITRHPWQLTIPRVMTIVGTFELVTRDHVDRLNSSTVPEKERERERERVYVYSNLHGHENVQAARPCFNFVT